MAPRLKILMYPGFKKGTQIYCPFLSKVSASESPPGSPVKEPSPKALHIEPLQRETLYSKNPHHPSLKVPSRLAPFQVSL
jgi:hypothetical protein